MIKEHIFRKYDIRGTVGSDFKVDDIYYLGKAIATYLSQRNPVVKSVIVGMDGRIHSGAIKEKLCQGLLESGFDVTFIGLCPTPVLYFATHVLPTSNGIMITASHNPGRDNGFKIVFDKENIWDKEITKIRDIYKNKLYINSNIPGKYSENFIVDKYVNYIKSKFEQLSNLAVNIAIDCGNGAAGSVIPLLTEKMDWKNVHIINQEIDGTFSNHEPDPTKESNMQQLKKYLQENPTLEFGIGLDGDCDRLAAMTKSGYLIPGDKLLGIFCQELAINNKKNNIVFDIKCSSGLSEFLIQLGLKPNISPTGHAYIKENMRINDAIFGGELSGHYCFKDRYFGYDDAIYAILRLIELIVKSDKSIDELLEKFPKKISSTEFRIECLEEKKNEIIQYIGEYFSLLPELEIIKIDGIRINASYGWGLIRASNTESVLSLRFEGNDETSLIKIKEDFYKPLSSFFEETWLKRQLNLG